ncbi:hypothetical protein FEJ81_13595 [Natrinema versiforme]|uniref:Uncharacterized protein n=1 Tax=Natrinema versiforme TaxID=88724 RepID=A0A4P8WJC2_9EURY|nr:hypothetical protein FEJ81_13595 [Natrinema versiforme]
MATSRKRRKRWPIRSRCSRYEVRLMARPVRFEWDDHDWSGKPHPHESPKEVRTNPQVASVGR